MSAPADGAHRTSPTLVIAVAAFAVLVWGASPFVTKIGTNDADSLTIGFLRTVVAAGVSVPLILLGRVAWPQTRAEWGWLAGSSLGGFFVFPVVYTIGIGYSTASHGALILAALPVMTGLIGALLERRLPPMRWWAGCVLAAAGLTVLIGKRSGFEGGSDPLLGDLLMLGASTICAFGYVAGARLSATLGSWNATMWGISIGAVLSAIGLTLHGGFAAAGAMGEAGWLAVFYLAFVVAIVGYVAWYWALAKGGVERTAPAQFYQPVVGVVLSIVFLDETLSALGVAAAAVILAGIWIARRRPAKRTEPAPALEEER
ncbi:MAG: DMT family transporter [Alphaproteobacteria bacterium]|nr:DMT family transporter [Alphaproteobacteria bacterium]